MIPRECCKMCFVALQLAAVRQGTGQAGGRFHFFSASPRESYAPYVLLTIASICELGSRVFCGSLLQPPRNAAMVAEVQVS
ncbi:hypothetical protein AK812_SmicGene25426 [Symbiodinium microadriaticum]|uniref:Uncharacterized protein n=1 Tax=Symbiodinium microadriaticum TaxID=2951 RepID=A0A1Q9DC54_SYMMI|nr:hypothetical protein AK812_SmicGene25426 [Symbiodinium microadriaticum]